jgi:hypothetical protein
LPFEVEFNRLGCDTVAFAAMTLAFSAASAHTIAMRHDFDPDDYALVVKLRDAQPNPWRWEIHCAGKRLPIERSRNVFASRGAAQTEGKLALQQLLSRLSG